jgi:Domain of unknown function (DUF4249)
VMREKISYLLLVISMLWGCKEIYDSTVKSPDTGYLVVEGAINSGIGTTIITLSRTTKLDTKKIQYEIGAQVSIEGDDKSSVLLKETSNGKYTGTNLTIIKSKKYQLKINTKNGEKYLSDFVAVNTNPPIDSITWEREKNGLQMYINTHDPTNNTRYYQWEYIETWEYHADKTSAVKYELSNPVVGVPTYKAVFRFPKTPGTIDPKLFFCWGTQANANIILGSTAKLSQDVIYQPIAFIPAESYQLSELFSINIRQISWTKEGFEFLEKIKKNTEKTGSIFDAQPSEIKGNIYCISNPTKPAIGYVTICPIQEKRYFIHHSEVPNWGYRPLYCTVDTLTNNNKAIYEKNGTSKIPTENGPCFGCEATDIKTFYAADPICVDCLLKGGTNIKPSFWPEK